MSVEPECPKPTIQTRSIMCTPAIDVQKKIRDSEPMTI
jgi:hypothetical protein